MDFNVDRSFSRFVNTHVPVRNLGDAKLHTLTKQEPARVAGDQAME